MENTATFCNPAPFSDGRPHTNPDPFVLHWGGKYYCYATDEDGVKVSVSDDLVHWEEKGFALRQEGRHAFWAPAVLYRNGVFYLYYSSNPIGEDDGNGEKMQFATAKMPLGPFVWQKELFSEFSIDAHPVLWQGSLYLFYSVNSWMGCDDQRPGTCILLDKLLAPDQPEGRPVPVILPSLEQEIFQKNRYGDGRDWYTLEGACFVPGPEKSFLLYSANCYTDVNYFVGYAVAENKPDLREMQWSKYPSPEMWTPLLKKSETVEGTGHNTVTCAPNGIDPWIVYHARDALKSLCPGQEQREMYLSPLKIYGDRLFAEAIHRAPQALPAQPAFSAREMQIDTLERFCPAPKYYTAQLWFTAARASTGACFDFFLRWQDEDNSLALRFHTGRREVSVRETVHGICRTLIQKTFPMQYEPFAPHTVELRVVGGEAEIEVEDTFCLTVSSRISQGAFAAAAYHSTVQLHAIAISEHLRLYGQQLWQLDALLPVSRGTLSERGLYGERQVLNMETAALPDGEMYCLLEAGRDACLTIEQPEKETVDLALPEGENAFRYQCVHNTAMLRLNGSLVLCETSLPSRFVLQNVVLRAVEETKL